MARGAPGHLGIIHLRPMVFIKIAWSYNNLGKQQLELCSTQGNRRSTGNTNECHDLRPVWLSSHLLFLCFEFLADLQDYFPLQINPRSPALPIAFASPKCVCHGRPQIATVGPQIAHWTRGTAHSIGRGNTAPAAPRPPARAPAPPSPCAHRFLLVRRPLRRP